MPPFASLKDPTQPPVLFYDPPRPASLDAWLYFGRLMLPATYAPDYVMPLLNSHTPGPQLVPETNEFIQINLICSLCVSKKRIYTYNFIVVNMLSNKIRAWDGSMVLKVLMRALLAFLLRVVPLDRVFDQANWHRNRPYRNPGRCKWARQQSHCADNRMTIGAIIMIWHQIFVI